MGADDALHGSSAKFIPVSCCRKNGKCSEAAILQSVPVRKAACPKYSRGKASITSRFREQLPGNALNFATPRSTAQIPCDTKSNAP